MSASVYAVFGIETRIENPIAAVRRKRSRIFTVTVIGICLPLMSLCSRPVWAIQPVTFAPQATFSVGGNYLPLSVATADFNGDGIIDLVTANQELDTVSVLLGKGFGSFGAATTFSVNGSAPAAVAAADFNRDGKIDIATANWASNNVSVLSGDGSGGFGIPSLYAVGKFPQSIAIGYFDILDGNVDLVTANSGSSNVSVLLGNSQGHFNTQPPFDVGKTPYSVTALDFNGDTAADMVTANSEANTVSLLIGSGSGHFFYPAFTFAVKGDDPVSVATADFNRDGKADLVTANWRSNNVSVMLGDGNAGITLQSSLAVGQNPHSVATADFNGDGNIDVVTANTGDDNVSVLLGDGSGGFGNQTTFAVKDSPVSVATADFNGDGKTDIVTANAQSANVSVLLNTTLFVDTTQPPLFTSLSDINNDGSPEIAAVRYDLGLQKTTAQVKSAKTGALIKRIAFDGQFIPKFVRSIRDLNGNGAVEIAVLGIRNQDQAVQVEIRDSRSGVKLSTVPFPAIMPPIGLTSVHDTSCSRNHCLVVLQQNTNVLRAQIKDALTGARIRNIGFDSGYKGKAITIIKSLNGNQSTELALLADNKIPNGADKVEIRDSKTGRLIRNINYEPGKPVRQLRILPDLNDNGDVELATLLPNDAQIVLVDAKTGLEINTINTTLAKPYFLARVTDKTSAIRPVLLGKRLADGQIQAEVYNSLTDKVVRVIVFSQIGTTIGFGEIADINGNGTSELKRVIKLWGSPKRMVEIRDGANGELINIIKF